MCGNEQLCPRHLRDCCRLCGLCWGRESHRSLDWAVNPTDLSTFGVISYVWTVQSWIDKSGHRLESCAGMTSYPHTHPSPWTWNPSQTVPTKSCPHPNFIPPQIAAIPIPLPYTKAFKHEMIFCFFRTRLDVWGSGFRSPDPRTHISSLVRRKKQIRKAKIGRSCVVSCIIQRVPIWMALYSLIVLMCR